MSTKASIICHSHITHLPENVQKSCRPGNLEIMLGWGKAYLPENRSKSLVCRQNKIDGTFLVSSFPYAILRPKKVTQLKYKSCDLENEDTTNSKETYRGRTHRMHDKRSEVEYSPNIPDIQYHNNSNDDNQHNL